MKYWRGYLTAGILLACAWALEAFAKGHVALMDTVYPYITRMMQMFLADWSGKVDFCVWQVLLLVLAAAAIGTLVLVLIFKWNPVQWFGWVCAVVAVVYFLNTGLFGLNLYAGSLAEDIRLEETDYTITELEKAAIYYRDQANRVSDLLQRDQNGEAVLSEFDVLAERAVNGYEKLVYEESLAVFAGPMQPVKKLRWHKNYTKQGLTGVTVGLTGEAAVNPDVPSVLMPFAICREMAHRASILIPKDASFGAYMACMANPDPQFQYSGALMGYRYCLEALEELGRDAECRAGENANVRKDLDTCSAFLEKGEQDDADTCDLLTSWHIQEVVLPGLVEEEGAFDPLDKSKVDLSDNPRA